MRNFVETARQERLWRAAGISLAILAVILMALHLVAVFTESINWDEFAFLFRGDLTLHTGSLHSGGRPGLALLALLPFASGCDDSVSAIRSARLLWSIVTFASVAGLFYLLRNAIPLPSESEPRWHRAAFAVAFLVLVPVWLRWSLQVRTDQWAIAFTLWGGVCLLASKDRASWLSNRPLAGGLMMCGYLATQKAIYVWALVGIVVLGHHLIALEWRWKRELGRAGLLLLGGALVHGVSDFGKHLFNEPYTPLGTGVGPGIFEVFALYRRWVGFHVYKAMLPTLRPHIFFLGVLIATSSWAIYERLFRSKQPPRVTRWQELVVAWALLALGYKIMTFHASAFPYFWLTVGLFPAAAVFFAYGPAAELAGKPRIVGVLAFGLWVMLAVPSLGQAFSLLADTQEIQRNSLAFVDRNFAPEDRGFHPESALACRDDPDPFPTFMSTHIRFILGKNPENRRDFIHEFRDRPVKFILGSFRRRQFPSHIRKFWNTHYVSYWPGVDIPGYRFKGKANTQHHFESFVEGTYRWRVRPDTEPARVVVDGVVLAPGGLFELERGPHQLTLLDDTEKGVLVYKVEDDWNLAGGVFYSKAMRREFQPGRKRKKKKK